MENWMLVLFPNEEGTVGSKVAGRLPVEDAIRILRGVADDFEHDLQHFLAHEHDGEEPDHA